MKNQSIKRLLTFTVLFLILLVVAIFHMEDYDQVWTYGFSYNISRGLIPYRDFNMIIGPLYNLLFSIPMLLFGNYLMAFKIFHLIIYSIILTIVYEKVGNRVLWIIAFLAIQSAFCWYNVFVGMLTICILILLDSNNKYKDLWIGLIIGFILMTKHNIGLALFLVYFFTVPSKKSILYVFIPVFLTGIYLLCTHTLFAYIDFCYLGMGGFISNLIISPVGLLFTIFVIYYYVKRYRKTKDIKILYVLSFLVMVFPLLERSHLLLGTVPMIYYIIKEENHSLIYKAMGCFIVPVFLISLVSISKTEVITDSNFFQYNSIAKGLNSNFKQYVKYINQLDGDVYLFTGNAYILRLYNNETTSFYDLINNGNLGRDENKYLEELDKKCKMKKCNFILDKDFFREKKVGWQISFSFKDFVIDHYDFVEILPSQDRLYNNEKRINN